MTRQITAIHTLPVRNAQGYHEYLFHHNSRWKQMTLPAKKLHGLADAESVRSVFDIVWHQEMGIDAPPAWLRPLEPFTVRLTSPAEGEVTEYRILTLLAPVPRREQRAATLMRGAIWGRRSDLVNLPDLSPTARLALEQVHQAPTLTSTPPQDGNWTQRLLWSRESLDRGYLGQLFLDMTPWLRSQLRKCSQTRSLFENSVDVEDTIAEALLGVMLHLNDFLDTASAAAWIWTITFNSAISTLRKRTRNAACSLHTPEGELRPVVTDDRDLLDHLELSEARSWQMRLVSDVLAQADPLHQRAWRLRHQEGMAYHEIATVLDRNANTVVGWIRRIDDRLRGRAQEPGRGC